MKRRSPSKTCVTALPPIAVAINSFTSATLRPWRAMARRSMSMVNSCWPDKPLDANVPCTSRGFDDTCHLLRQFAQLFQVVAENLDCDLRAHAGYHLVHALLDRLRQDDVYPRQYRESLAYILFDLLLGAAGALQIQYRDGIGFVLAMPDRRAIRPGQALTPRSLPRVWPRSVSSPLFPA